MFIRKFIKAKEYRYTAPYQAHPLKPLKTGGYVLLIVHNSKLSLLS